MTEKQNPFMGSLEASAKGIGALCSTLRETIYKENYITDSERLTLLYKLRAQLSCEMLLVDSCIELIQPKVDITA